MSLVTLPVPSRLNSLHLTLQVQSHPCPEMKSTSDPTLAACRRKRGDDRLAMAHMPAVSCSTSTRARLPLPDR